MTAGEKQQSNQPYYILWCRQQPLTEVVNSGEGEGMEAWRILVDFHEPAVKSRVAGHLLGLLSWSFCR